MADIDLIAGTSDPGATLRGQTAAPPRAAPLRRRGPLSFWSDPPMPSRRPPSLARRLRGRAPRRAPPLFPNTASCSSRVRHRRSARHRYVYQRSGSGVPSAGLDRDGIRVHRAAVAGDDACRVTVTDAGDDGAGRDDDDSGRAGDSDDRGDSDRDSQPIGARTRASSSHGVGGPCRRPAASSTYHVTAVIRDRL